MDVQVSTEDAQAYADENGLVYMETSAKTNANVSELFDDIAKRCGPYKLPYNGHMQYPDQACVCRT